MTTPPRPRLTVQVKMILTDLLDQDGPTWIAAAAFRTSLSPKTVSGILHRLHEAGWATSEWEAPDERVMGARRRFFQLTSEGRAEAVKVRDDMAKRAGACG